MAGMKGMYGKKKKKTKTTRLEIQRGARSPRAFCVILGGLTLKKWSRIGFHVGQTGGINQNK